MPTTQPRRYAQDTRVSVEQSMSELRDYLRKQGAKSVLMGDDEDAHLFIVGFRMHDRHIRFRLSTADLDAQQQRQRMRALIMIVKGKFEAVELGIESFDRVFLANLMLPDGTTVGEWLEPHVETIYRDGTMPPLLPGLEAGPRSPQIHALPARTG